MVCTECRKQAHEYCDNRRHVAGRGKGKERVFMTTWCDCQHKDHGVNWQLIKGFEDADSK